MLRLLNNVLLLVVFAGFVWFVWPESELRHPPGLLVKKEPVQSGCPQASLGNIRGYDLTAVASYELGARVLHTKRYWADHADLAPIDVALGWGPMSDQQVLDQLEISQGNRFFFYQWQNTPPIPLTEIVRHAANHHIISATPEVAKVIRNLRRGQFVRMRGKLVNVTRPDGFHWTTSTTREDSGNGACEIFYVEGVRVANEPI